MLDDTSLDPVHPGEILAEEFLAPKGLSAAALARHIGLPANRVSEIVAGRRNITGDTALRLAAAFGASAEFWMGLQMRWELAVAARREVGDVTPPLTSRRPSSPAPRPGITLPRPCSPRTSHAANVRGYRMAPCGFAGEAATEPAEPSTGGFPGRSG